MYVAHQYPYKNISGAGCTNEFNLPVGSRATTNIICQICMMLTDGVNVLEILKIIFYLLVTSPCKELKVLCVVSLLRDSSYVSQRI